MEARRLISSSTDVIGFTQNFIRMKRKVLHVHSTEQSFSAALQAQRAISYYDSFHASFICLLSLDKMSANTVKVNSFIKGYYEYQADWEPTVEDI